MVSEKPLYRQLQARKDNGEQLNFDEELDKLGLLQLWLIEGISDTGIADLFNIEPKEVQKKRYILGIKALS